LRLLDAARAFFAFREDSHYYIMLPLAVIRRLALELGRRLAARGVLAEAEDIFLLTIDEVGAQIRGSPGAVDGVRPPLAPAEVRSIVQRRQAARQSAVGRSTPVPAELLTPPDQSDEVRGVAVSPGQATGRARVILGEQDFWKLQHGEVLVAHYTNPAWTPLFALAGAVVVDAGGAGSHAAIVAREYGIPAVMGTGNATTRLRDGQPVLVDGSRGRVTPLNEH
jgi:pyruvate,water dikinase